MTKFEWRMNSQPITTRRKFYPPRVSLQVVMIFMTLFCIFCGVFRFVTYQDDASDTSAKNANQRFQQAWSLVRVPDEAKHVNLYARYIGGGADFEISTQGFIAWCDEQGWTPKERRSPPPEPPIFFGIGPDDVRHAYYYSNGTHRGGWDVMYDIDRQRAWVHLSSR